jgi:hypothetical protein
MFPRALFLPILLASLAAPAAAQETPAVPDSAEALPDTAAEEEPSALLLRVVASESGERLPGAVVRVDGAVRGATDDDGWLRMHDLPAGRRRVEVTALGRRPLSPEVELPAGWPVELEVALDPDPVALAGVEARGAADGGETREVRRRAEDLAGFYDRAAARLQGAVFLRRADIDDMRYSRFTDLMRNVPVVIVVERRTGPELRLRFVDPSLTLGARGPVNPARGDEVGCVPTYYLDGRPVPVQGSPDLFRLQDIEGVELYPARPPHIFLARSDCGVIAIWRRI